MSGWFLFNSIAMFQQLRTVIYQVNNIEKAKQWYTGITGIQPYFDEPFYVGFDINGFELGLDPDDAGVKKGNNAVAYWKVAAINEAVELMVKAGAKLQTPVNNVGGSILVATLEDPFGNVVGLIQED